MRPKQLFSHPRMIEDLLRGFIPKRWVVEINFETLEKVSGNYVSDELREREDDIIWRARWYKRHDWVYFYLLIEFQSTVDRFMAVRVMVYLGLLYQDLIKAKLIPKDGKLPPVLPLVLYNGEKT
jgi:predicted transposase YdaD